MVHMNQDSDSKLEEYKDNLVSNDNNIDDDQDAELNIRLDESVSLVTRINVQNSSTSPKRNVVNRVPKLKNAFFSVDHNTGENNRDLNGSILQKENSIHKLEINASLENRPAENGNENNIIIESGDGNKHISIDVKHDPPEKPNDDLKVPLDKGWAWFVMLGTMLEMTIIIGILKSAGIIFVAFQDRFNSTSSMTSLISTVQNAVYSVTAPLVLSVGKRVTTSRRLLFIGSTIMCSAYVVTSQARDMRVLLFSHGVLQGIGSAFMQPVAIVTLASYFDKKRGFANSFAVSGGSLGGLIFAPLLNFLLSQYGYQGCFLIIAAIFLHGYISGALFRPQSFYKRIIKKPLYEKSTIQERQSLFAVEMKESNRNTERNVTNGIEKKFPRAKSLEQQVVHRQFSIDHERGEIEPQVNGEIKQNSVRKRTITESSTRSWFDSHHSINKSMDYMCGSALDIAADQNTDKPEDFSPGASKTKSKVSPKALLKIVVLSFDFTLFKNPIFCILQAASFIICANTTLGAIYIAPHIRDLGFEVKDIALIVTVFSSTDLISRIVIALISDRGWIRRSNMTAITTFILGISANFLRFYKSYEFLMFYGVVLGLFSGVYFSLVSVLIVDYLTIHKLQAAFGFTSLFHGAGVSLFFYVIGYLRDETGSYIVPFHVIGCGCLIGSLLHFSLPFVERYQKLREGRNGKVGE